MSAKLDGSRVRASGLPDDRKAATLDPLASAFGLSAAIVIVFNTLLAWVKDSFDPLNSFMASLTGHHWITHGLTDVLLFFALGAYFLSRRVSLRGEALVVLVIAAVVVGGGGLVGWFLFV